MPRIKLWMVLAVVALLGVLAPLPPVCTGLLFLILSWTVSSSLVPDRADTSTVTWLPLGAVLVACWVCVVGLLGGAFGLAPWGSRAAAQLTVLGVVLLAGLVVVIRRGSVSVFGGDWTATLLAGLVFVVGTGLMVVRPLGAWSRVLSYGTDFARHAWSTILIARSGAVAGEELSYPRSLHALGSAFLRMRSDDPSVQAAWLVQSSLLWAFLSLAVTAVVVGARLAADRWTGQAKVGLWVSLIAGFAMIQTAWFSVFVQFGSIMNVLAGLCLATLVVVLLAVPVGSTASVVGAAAAVGLVANTWQLVLPVAVGGALAVFVAWLRTDSRPVWVWSFWGIGAGMTIPGILGMVGTANYELITGPTVSGLFAPDWWWWLGLLGSVFTGVGLYRAGHRWASIGLAAMLASGAATFAYLFYSSGTTWDLLRYYPVKTLWTCMVIVIPLGCAALGVSFTYLWQAAKDRPGVPGSVGKAVTVALGVAIAAGVAGRAAAFPPHLVTLVKTDNQPVNWSLATLDSVSGSDFGPAQKRGAIVFGMIPEAPVSAVVPGGVGLADYISMEGLEMAGFDGTMNSPVKWFLYTRDLGRICAWLGDHPAAVRFTGPNPKSGADFLLEAGCPKSSVRPENWVALPLTRDWVSGTPYQAGKQFNYPTWHQVQALLQERERGPGSQAGANLRPAKAGGVLED